MGRLILTIFSLAWYAVLANAQPMPPPVQLQTIQALNAAVMAACPDIDGVNSDKIIHFKPKASDECKAKAEAAAKSFVPPK